MVVIKHCSTVILGIDHHRKRSYFGTNGSIKGIGQQCPAKPLSLEILIDRQPAKVVAAPVPAPVAVAAGR